MKYLLDTCTVLWFFSGSVKCNPVSRGIIESETAQKFVSVVSLWEFVMKNSTGKLQFDGGFANFLELSKRNGFHVIPILRTHLEQLYRLPFHHRDPFDRLLVATAQTEDMTIVTSDADFRKYDVNILL